MLPATVEVRIMVGGEVDREIGRIIEGADQEIERGSRPGARVGLFRVTRNWAHAAINLRRRRRQAPEPVR